MTTLIPRRLLINVSVICVLASLSLLASPSAPASAQDRASAIYADATRAKEAAEASKEADRVVVSLRDELVNATTVMSLVRDPDFPHSLPRWYALRRRYPQELERLEPCVDLLVEALHSLKAQDRNSSRRLIDKASVCIRDAPPLPPPNLAPRSTDERFSSGPSSGPSSDPGGDPSGDSGGRRSSPFLKPRLDTRTPPKPHAPWTCATTVADMRADCMAEQAFYNPQEPLSERDNVCSQSAQHTYWNMSPDCGRPRDNVRRAGDLRPLTGGLGDRVLIGGSSYRFNPNTPYFNGFINGYGREIQLTIDIRQEAQGLKLTREIRRPSGSPRSLIGTITPILSPDKTTLNGLIFKVISAKDAAGRTIRPSSQDDAIGLYPSSSRLVDAPPPRPY